MGNGDSGRVGKRFAYAYILVEAYQQPLDCSTEMLFYDHTVQDICIWWWITDQRIVKIFNSGLQGHFLREVQLFWASRTLSSKNQLVLEASLVSASYC